MNRACLTKNTNLHEQKQHASSPASAGQAIRPIKNNFVRMKKQFNLQLIFSVVLISLIMIFTTCKKDTTTTIAKVTDAPTVKVNPATWVNQTWATLNGVVNANNLMTTINFEYDTSTVYGHSIVSTPDTMSGSKDMLVIANLTGLTVNTTYHFRIKAVNSLGTTFGKDTTFTTPVKWVSNTVFNPDLIYGSVIDVDGNSYKTIEIGTQTWMAENLRTTKYKDNTNIPMISSSTPWAALSSPGFCWYNHDSISYGAIYNWYAVNTDNLCPAGWHIPSDDEWTTLTTFLGGENVAGNKLRETGTTHWASPNSGATNSSGFSALPGGFCRYDGVFNNIRKHGYWWSVTEFSSIEVYYRDLASNYIYVNRSSSSKNSGFSVRCLKDILKPVL
jgi:uncharacterized protein (TIGR02145 family)